MTTLKTKKPSAPVKAVLVALSLLFADSAFACPANKYSGPFGICLPYGRGAVSDGFEHAKKEVGKVASKAVKEASNFFKDTVKTVATLKPHGDIAKSIFDDKPAPSEIVIHAGKGSTITADTLWNLTGTLSIKIISKDGNCASNVWWTGVTNKHLGKKCGEFEVNYSMNPLEVRALRLGGFESDSIVYIKQNIHGVTNQIYNSQWASDYARAKSLYNACGSTVSCWYQKLNS